MAIEMLSEPHWLEKVSWICQIILTLLALVAAWFAYVQIRQIKSDSTQQLKISHATLLLDLDHRWDHDMRPARDIFEKFSRQIEAIVDSKNPKLAGPARMAVMRVEWRLNLAQARRSSTDEYIVLLGICGFFETVGLMVKRGYLASDDILALLKGPLIGIDACFREHLESRAKEKGMPKGLFENAFLLFDLAKAQKG